MTVKREMASRAVAESKSVVRRAKAITIRSSSIFLGRIVGVMFMRVNSKCAHHLRPPLAQRQPCASFCRSDFGGLETKVIGVT